jgi:type I restriction enzyme, S subunit
MTDSPRPNRKKPWPVPPTWEWTTAGDICTVVGGGTPPTANPTNFEGGAIPWITPADLTGYEHKTISRGARNITEEGLASSGARIMPAGTVLFSSRAPIGYVAITENPVSTNQGFKSFILSSAVTSDFLYYYLQFAKPLAVALASGTTFLEISGAKAAQIPVPVAPLREQECVVSEIEKQFSRLDAANAALKRVKVNLKRYRASALKAACEGRLVPTEAELARKESREYEPADKLLERILRERRARWEADTLAKTIASGVPPKDDRWKQKYKEPTAPDAAKLPDLPEGWCWANLEQLKSHSIYGPRFSSDDYSESGIVVLRTTDISQTGKVDVSQAPRLQLTEQEFDRFQLRQRDLVFTRTGATVGKVAIFDDTIRAIPGAYLIHYRLIFSEHVSWYVYRFFQSDKGQRALTGGTRGIGQPNLNAPTIESIPIPLPPLDEQNRIEVKLDEVLGGAGRLTEILLAELGRSRSLRKSILRHAFSGKLVSQYPTDEPASVLLDRIRAGRALANSKSAVKRTKKDPVYA